MFPSCWTTRFADQNKAEASFATLLQNGWQAQTHGASAPICCPDVAFFLPSPWPGETLSWIANSTKCVKPVPYLCFCAAPLARKKTWHAASHLLQGQESRSIWLKHVPAFLHRFRTSTDFCFRKGETLNRTGQPSSNTPALIFSKRRRKSYKPAFPEKARVGVPPATGSSFKSVSTIQRKKVEDLLHLLCCFFWKNARKFNVHNACIQRHTLTRRIFLAWLYCNFVILKYGPKCLLGQKHVAEAEKIYVTAPTRGSSLENGEERLRRASLRI